VPIAAVIAASVGSLTYFLLDRREREKPEAERNWWVPLLVAAGVVAVVGILAYILGALVRIGVGMG
jgi:heme A synthase